MKDSFFFFKVVLILISAFIAGIGVVTGNWLGFGLNIVAALLWAINVGQIYEKAFKKD